MADRTSSSSAGGLRACRQPPTLPRRASVTVLDREGEAGGIPRHCNHPPYGLREFHRLMRGPDYARASGRDAALAAGVTIRTRTTVTALHPGGMVEITSPQGPEP